MADRMGEWPHDAKQIWNAQDAGLGACVLHTTAQSLETEQPLTNETGSVVLVFDGYLTNWEELRRDLEAKGAVLRNRSDAELVLRAYEQWGENCAERIEGEFAFAIVDRANRRAFCARDRKGLRPLYYMIDRGALIVASRLPVLIAGLGRKPDFDLDYLAQTMVGEVYSVDHTAWKAVRRLKAAHCMSYSAGSLETRRYYDLPEVRIRRYRSDAEYIEEYRAVFEDSVRRTSRSHLPLAFEVSGGLDSSAIFCLAHGMEKRGGILAPSIDAFALRGEPGAYSDEIDFARAASDYVSRELHETELFRPDLQWFNNQVSSEHDLPTYTNAAQSILMEQAISDRGARVAINGMGGDQWLDGTLAYYDQNLQAMAFGRLARNMARDMQIRGKRRTAALVARKVILALAPDRLRPLIKAMKGGGEELYVDDVMYLTPFWAERVRLEKRHYEASLPPSELARINRRKLDQLGNQRAFDLMYRQRSRLGIEGRSPMLTRQFIEFCSALPEDLKLRGGQTKWIHREAMRGLMPDCIVERSSKASFPERKHDEAIRELCEFNKMTALEGLVDPARFSAFCEMRHERDIDDLWGWPYWGAYMVTAFMSTVGPEDL